MIEGEPAAAGSGAATAGYKGTKGLFYEVEHMAVTYGLQVQLHLHELILRLSQKVLDQARSYS